VGEKGAGRRGTAPSFNIRQLTDVLHCNLQQHFRCKQEHVQPRSRIDKMVLTRPTERHQHRARLNREPAAVAEARSEVRALICAWRVPVDPDIAVLLTSDLVTNAIMHGTGKTITLVIRCSRGQLRIDSYDTSRSLPMDEPAVAETGHGLVLVAALSTEWGSFLTPAGKVAYFTLAFPSDLPPGRDGAAVGGHTCGA
jgi:anti-sigma regulatory factor (Ser/Thr protein kinase)